MRFCSSNTLITPDVRIVAYYNLPYLHHVSRDGSPAPGRTGTGTPGTISHRNRCCRAELLGTWDPIIQRSWPMGAGKPKGCFVTGEASVTSPSLPEPVAASAMCGTPRFLLLPQHVGTAHGLSYCDNTSRPSLAGALPLTRRSCSYLPRKE